MRRNLQRAYLRYILHGHLLAPDSSLPQDARSAAWASLTELKANLDALFDADGAAKFDPLSDAHLRESQARIAKALDASLNLATY